MFGLGTVMSKNSMSSLLITPEGIAVNRFGYGAKADEIVQAKLAPKAWIKSQLLPITFSTSLAHSNDILIEHAKYRKQKKHLKNKRKVNKDKKKTPDQSVNNMAKNYARKALQDMSIDSLTRSITSSHSVSWRLFDFFSNHFSVSANGRLMVGLSATLEREAIGPNLLGNFEDMLLAVEQHPAMLIYLNNERSFGPNSIMAKKRAKGLNENLAREIMELHTLGVDGGYS